MEKKPSNPKDAISIKKVPFTLIPENVIAELGLALLEGSRKYGSYNWRIAGVRASVYIDALRRHLGAWWNGENIDPDSGVSHITKAIACLVILRDSMMINNWTDDRPPKLKEGWIQEFNKKAGNIIDRHPKPKDPYLAKHTQDEEYILKDRVRDAIAGFFEGDNQSNLLTMEGEEIDLLIESIVTSLTKEK